MPQPSGTARERPPAGAVVHLVAELSGIARSCLHDTALLGGLLIAAAGAAGLHAISSPILRTTDHRGVDGLLMLDGGHAAIHAHSDRGTLLLDLLTVAPAELAKALEVFIRRLHPTNVSAERIMRGAATP